jgi:hypothetical protein
MVHNREPLVEPLGANDEHLATVSEKRLMSYLFDAFCTVAATMLQGCPLKVPAGGVGLNPSLPPQAMVTQLINAIPRKCVFCMFDLPSE